MGLKTEYLIVDTSAFIKNVPLQDYASNVITTLEVVNEIKNKRQLRRLVVLPYDLSIKEVFTENIQFVTDFAKKTGDYLSLSATDIKVIALTYQLEKEHVGTDHLNKEPSAPPTINLIEKKTNPVVDVSGFFKPNFHAEKLEPEHIKDDGADIQDPSKESEELENSENVSDEEYEDVDDNILQPVEEYDSESCEEEEEDDDDDDDDESDWITPKNLNEVKIQIGNVESDEKPAIVGCITTDFAMQNVLKQIGLKVIALDGKVIKKIRTCVFRCYTCFKIVGNMTKVFCPKCGNKTLKRVTVSLDENGKQVIHINLRRPLSGRGKKFSLPTPRGGKHSNYPILFEDQPMPMQRPSRQSRMKTDPLNPDYIAGYSPFVTRDTCSRSAMLGIRPGSDMKNWARSNQTKLRRKRK